MNDWEDVEHKVVALIPIKLNNVRVPGKNIKLFTDGTPLMSLIQGTCLNSKEIDETYIYCSDDSVKEYIEEGIKFLKRPAWLDGDNINSNDIISEFIKEVDASIYVETHATGPFTKSESIDKCVSLVKTGEYDSAFLACKRQEFIWKDGKALNFDVQHFPRTQDLDPVYAEAPGAYVFTKECFELNKRRVGNRPYIHEISKIEAWDIDNPEDFILADAIYMNLLKGGINK